jgi:hypothetical protein
MGHLSLKRLSEEGSFTGTLEDMLRLWIRGSLSIGAPLLGNMVGCSFLRVFHINRQIKRYVKMPGK